MLNIRISVAIDVRKWAVTLAAFCLLLGQLFTPAHAYKEQISFKKQIVLEKSVTVHLQYLNVTTTKSQAKEAIKSSFVKYFDPEALAFLTVYAKGDSLLEWKCLDMIWLHESHFNPKALNMSSKAFGIAQFMPSTWDNYKVSKTADAALQIKYGLHYIQKRYGDACSAWNFWKKHSWY